MMYNLKITPAELDWLRNLLEDQRQVDMKIVRSSDDRFKTFVDRKVMITVSILDKLKNAEHENTNEKL